MLSSTVCGEQTKPQGCEPTETTVPLTRSTYSNNSLYFFLTSLYAFSLSTASHILATSFKEIPNALPTSRIAPLS